MVDSSDFVSDGNVDWTALGQTVIGGIFAAYVGTILEVLARIGDFFDALPDVVGAHYVEHVDRTVGAFTEPLSTAVYSFELALAGPFSSVTLGPFAWVVAVGTVVVMLVLVSEVISRYGI